MGGATRIVNDGDPLDLSGPEDGKIDLCLSYLYVMDAPGDPLPGVHTSLIFTAPTTIYVTGRKPGVSGKAVHIYNTYAVTPAFPIEWAPLRPGGVQIVVAAVTSGTAGTVVVGGSCFAGSIYAPQSLVSFGASMFVGTCDCFLEYLVGREVQLWGATNMSLPVGQGGSSSSSGAGSSRITGWKMGE